MVLRRMKESNQTQTTYQIILITNDNRPEQGTQPGVSKNYTIIQQSIGEIIEYYSVFLEADLF